MMPERPAPPADRRMRAVEVGAPFVLRSRELRHRPESRGANRCSRPSRAERCPSARPLAPLRPGYGIDSPRASRTSPGSRRPRRAHRPAPPVHAEARVVVGDDRRLGGVQADPNLGREPVLAAGARRAAAGSRRRIAARRSCVAERREEAVAGRVHDLAAVRARSPTAASRRASAARPPTPRRRSSRAGSSSRRCR